MLSQTSKKRGNTAIDGASDESNGLCNLGLQRLPENCTIIKVDVDGKTFPLVNRDVLYVGRGSREVVFASDEPGQPGPC